MYLTNQKAPMEIQNLICLGNLASAAATQLHSTHDT